MIRDAQRVKSQYVSVHEEHPTVIVGIRSVRHTKVRRKSGAQHGILSVHRLVDLVRSCWPRTSVLIATDWSRLNQPLTTSSCESCAAPLKTCNLSEMIWERCIGLKPNPPLLLSTYHGNPCPRLTRAGLPLAMQLCVVKGRAQQ